MGLAAFHVEAQTPPVNPLFNNNGAAITIRPGAVMIVKSGSLHNMTSGQMDNAGRLIVEEDFTNDANVTGANTSSGVFEIKGDWYNNNTFTANQSHVKLNSPLNPQWISGSQVTNFYNLTLDSTTVKTQTINAFTNNVLNINDCELATDVHTMTVTNKAIAAIQRTTGFVSSLGVGQLERYTNKTVPYLFPVGSSLGIVRYRPVTITPDDTTTNHYGARLANTAATSEGFDLNTKQPDICAINPAFFHRIYRNSGNTPADIRLFYDQLADGTWETSAHWQNGQWEKITSTISGTNAPWSIKTIPSWNNFASSPAHALANLLPVIDTSNIEIISEYCTVPGSINGITVSNLMPGTTYSWMQNTNIVSTGIVGNTGIIPIFKDMTGVYSLVIDKPNGCAAAQTYSIGFIPTYTTNIQGTNVLCFNGKTGSADLSINGGFSPFSYLWSNGATTQDLQNIGAGQYVVTIRDNKNCVQKDTIIITQPPQLVTTTQLTPETCERVDGTASVTASGGVPPYSYLWNTTPPQSTSAISDLAAGTYSIEVTDDNGCKSTKLVNIYNIPTPTALFQADAPIGVDILEMNGTINFENLSANASTYQWNFGDGQNGGGTNPTHTYAEPGTYMVTMTAYNSLGCKDEYILGPFIIVPNGTIYVPNAFSPNGDGKNDYFNAIGEGVSSFQMIIFDRWGKEIVTLNSLTDLWDGTAKGQTAPEGVYTYIMNVTLNTGTVFKRAGTITLFR